MSRPGVVAAPYAPPTVLTTLPLPHTPRVDSGLWLHSADGLVYEVFRDVNAIEATLALFSIRQPVTKPPTVAYDKATYNGVVIPLSRAMFLAYLGGITFEVDHVIQTGEEAIYIDNVVKCVIHTWSAFSKHITMHIFFGMWYFSRGTLSRINRGYILSYLMGNSNYLTAALVARYNLHGLAQEKMSEVARSNDAKAYWLAIGMVCEVFGDIYPIVLRGFWLNHISRGGENEEFPVALILSCFVVNITGNSYWVYDPANGTWYETRTSLSMLCNSTASTIRAAIEAMMLSTADADAISAAFASVTNHLGTRAEMSIKTALRVQESAALLHQDERIISYPNGVVRYHEDGDNSHLVIRKAMPSDFIINSCTVPLPLSCFDDPRVSLSRVMVMFSAADHKVSSTFRRQMYLDDEQYRLRLAIICSCFNPDVRRNKVGYFFVGYPDAGKTGDCERMHNVLGGRTVPGYNSFLMASDMTEGTNNHTAAKIPYMKDSNVLVNYPDFPKGVTMDLCNFKAAVGGDWDIGRDVGEKSTGKFKYTARTSVYSNGYGPLTKEAGAATYRRMVFFWYLQRFRPRTYVPDTEEEQYALRIFPEKVFTFHENTCIEAMLLKDAIAYFPTYLKDGLFVASFDRIAFRTLSEAEYGAALVRDEEEAASKPVVEDSVSSFLSSFAGIMASTMPAIVVQARPKLGFTSIPTQSYGVLHNAYMAKWLLTTHRYARMLKAMLYTGGDSTALLNYRNPLASEVIIRVTHPLCEKYAVHVALDASLDDWEYITEQMQILCQYLNLAYRYTEKSMPPTILIGYQRELSWL